MTKIFLVLGLALLFAVLAWVALKFFPGKSKAEEVWPRLFGGLVVSALLLAGLYFVSPQQAEVVFYKFVLVIAGAFVGYWIDRALFPYSRPDGYLKWFWQSGTQEKLDEADYALVAGYENVFAIAMLRRAMIIIAVVLGVTLGL